LVLLSSFSTASDLVAFCLLLAAFVVVAARVFCCFDRRAFFDVSFDRVGASALGFDAVASASPQSVIRTVSLSALLCFSISLDSRTIRRPVLAEARNRGPEKRRNRSVGTHRADSNALWTREVKWNVKL
jgi:hypothetical protein